MSQAGMLETQDLTVLLGGRKRWLRRSNPPFRAVNAVSLSIREGEIFGLIGESGCGKTTLGRTLLGVQREAGGEIRLAGRVVSGLPTQRARMVRRDIQYVHQDAGAALDPWWSIGRTLEEGLKIHRIGSAAERRDRVSRVLVSVGLDAAAHVRYPHELSGGQLRRVALARILLLTPRIVILDEPTSGLDMSVQATVLNLLLDLRRREGLTYLFISHDLSVVERLCDRVAIMYLGRIVEQAPTREIFLRPCHPYTRALLAAAPKLEGGEPDRSVLVQGEPAGTGARQPGCVFAPRCTYADDRCRKIEPDMQQVGDAHTVACHRWELVAAGRS